MATAFRKTRKIDRVGTIEIVECWARYCTRGNGSGLGWPRKTLLGKWRDGLPSNLCPICIGREKPHQDCPVCGGDGRVKLEAMDNKANPAFITGNGPRSYHDDDPRSQRVDWIVCTMLTDDERTIIRAEFLENGNRNMKISRLRIRHSTFNELLDSALDRIAEELS